MSRPLILVSNDDGYRAPGISTLATVAKEFGEVIVSAPSEERSGASQALTFRSLLRSERVGENAYSVSGTPADSVYLGILHHCPRPPSLVLAGINDGYNLGPDVYYSGTVGAAREGYFRGTSAIAASVDHGADAERLVPALRRIIAKVLSLHAQGQRSFLNVNAPRAIESDEIKVTRLGERRYADRVERRTDLSGKEYYWIGGPPLPAPLGVETDSGAVLAGYVSITPMIIDVSDPHLEPWREKLKLD